MKIAVEGCMHGELDKVYATLKRLEEAENTKIDLLICCGDFQAVRNENDLESLNVKPKYRSMNTFWKYYSGQAVAPYPTIFIGGNHEASNYLWELYYGGWAAPNIYFLGFAGIVKFGNIRIGGLSGIYKQGDYSLGHYERPPYNERDIRSVYHVRKYDVMKLMQVKEPVDIFMSHDWPLGITEYGNWEKLVRRKPFFKEEVEKRTLGSKPAAELLHELKPAYWFSAHLHCKFSAMIQHGEDGPLTKFLALDKCLRGRRFLQIVEIESDPGPYEIQYDEEWLAITRNFNNIFPLTRRSMYTSVQLDNQENRHWVKNKLDARGTKPFEFARTVPSYDPSQPCPNRAHYDLLGQSHLFLLFHRRLDGWWRQSSFPPDSDGSHRAGHCRNPQTESLLQFLELPYLLDTVAEANTAMQSIKFNSADFDSCSADEGADVDDIDELEELAEDGIGYD